MWVIHKNKVFVKRLVTNKEDYAIINVYVDKLKEVVLVKKVYITTAAVLLAGMMGATQTFAAAATISAKVGKQEVSYKYYPGESADAEKDVTKLFSGVRKVTESRPVDIDIEITSVSQSNNPVNVSLRIADKAEGEDYYEQAINYYDFVITAENGDVVYNSDTMREDELEIPRSRDMFLGAFNTNFSTETQKYKITCKANPEAAKSVVEADLKSIKFYLVPTEEKPNVVITAAPSTVTEQPQTEAATQAPVAEADPTQTPAPSESPEATSEPKISKRVCGEDIDPGRYIVKGNGIVQVVSDTGEIKTETTVTDGTNKEAKGVEQFVTTLEEGDIVTTKPLPGDKKGEVRFEKQVTYTQKPATAAAANTSNSKTNPKTGDNSLAIGIIIGCMAVAGAAVAGLEIFKRRKTN